MQIKLAPTQSAQYHPETGAVVEPGDITEITDRALAVSLLEQTDKWQPVGKAKPPTIAEILAAVDGDPDKAAAALDVEQAGANRKSLITQLETIVSTGNGAQAQEGDA